MSLGNLLLGFLRAAISPGGQATVALAVATVLLVVGIVGAAPQPRGYRVHLNSHYLGTVEDREMVENLYQHYVDEAQEESDLEVFARESLVVEEIDLTSETEMATPPLVASRMLENLTFVARASAIVVDGEEIVTLSSRQEAEEILKYIKEAYKETVKARTSGQASIESVHFMQDISIEPRYYDPDSIDDPERAKDLLMRGTDEVKVHVVSRGDSLWTIASTYGMSVADIEDANPDLPNAHLVRPGDEVNLVIPRPLITLASEEKTTVTREIPFNTRVVNDRSLYSWQRVVRQAGVAGEEQLTYRIKREDGREVSRELIDEEVLKPPVERIMAQGVRQVPGQGTGSYVWPLSGRITSGYGWRASGFHQGVDISAPIGSPIVAADSGTVTTAGWQGNYGITVIIDHGGGRIVTLYAHLSRTAVSVGQRVAKGQVIGYVGTTGRSTGPHLHFEVRLNGQPTNPVTFYSRHN